MASKQNCWEYKDCGRQPGGAKVHQLGVCAAATDVRGDGVHGGENCGRTCWALAGTLCGGQVQGTFAAKLGNCLRCDFYQEVSMSEGHNLVPLTELNARLS